MPNNANGIVNPYGAGAVRLDSTPYARYYMQQEAHKRAKDEALDRYFGDMEKNLTPTGMRTIDVPLLIEGKRKAQEFWIKNKRAIKNPDLDNGQSLLEYSKYHNNNLGLIQGSKNEFTGNAKLAAMSADPNKSALINDDIFKKMDANSSKPIGTQGFVSVDDIINDPIFHAKPYSIQEQKADFGLYGDMAGKPKPQIDPSKTIINPNNPLEDINTYVTQYDDKGLKNIGIAAADRWENDPRTRITFSNEHYDNLDEAEKVAQRVLGKEFQIRTLKDKYIAETILGHSIPAVETKKEANSARVLAKKAADAAALARTRAALRPKPKSKGQSDEDWLEGQVADLENSASNDPKNKIIISGPEGTSKAVILGVPAPVLKVFSINSGGQNIEPDDMAQYNDGTGYKPIFYKRDKDFNIIKNADGGKIVDNTIPSTKMSRKQLKAAYGKAFATGANLTGQFEESEVEQPQSNERKPRQLKGVPVKGF